MDPRTDRVDEFTQGRWDERWEQEDTLKLYDPSASRMLADSLALIRGHWAGPRNGAFLEAGSGPAANALHLALEGASVTCVDLSRVALARAEEEFARQGIDAAFVVADVRRLPFAEGSFDFVYAGGVVEHFRDTKDALAEFSRVLRPGGRALVTVPALTASYPYLFMRGNVPCVPLLEDMLAFVHFRLLRGRYAEFGYERSFTRRRFAAEMRSAGFSSVETGCFDTYLPLGRLPGRLRPLGRRLARLGVFCPMYWALGVR